MRSDLERLYDVIESIERIEKYTTGNKARFFADELVQTWVLYHLQLLGEAVVRISTEITDRYPEIPWRQIIGMRNILVHDYFGIDADVVWNVVENDLPELKKNIGILIEQYQ
ncbi:DUF86 domain-containing protein [bacterium]|nr:DUF86 domain-containing protein [bacterium]